MKHVLKVFLIILIAFLLISCKPIFRDFNEDDLEDLVIIDFDFSEMLFFKIVDSNTAKELTGKSYNLGGVIVGIKDEQGVLVFIPKKVSEEPFMIDTPFEFNITDIYSDLRLLEDSSGHLLFDDPSGDYGGLSIDSSVYDSVKNINANLVFDSKVFFVITTDQNVFYVGFVSGNHIIFNEGYQRISS